MTHLASLNGRRWVRSWARTPHGERTLEELLDLGYKLPPPPISGGARDFDGTDDKIARAGDDALLDVADSTSVLLQAVAFSDVVNDGANRVIAGKRTDTGTTTAGYLLYKSATGPIRFGTSDGADGTHVVSASAITVSTWHHVMGYLQANSAANDDLGNVLDTTFATEQNSVVMGTLANTRPFRVGSNGWTTPGDFWNGRIAFVRQWSRSGAWTQAQLDQVVAWRNFLYLPPMTQIDGAAGAMNVEWIGWDTGSPTTAIDYSGNGLDGTYTGTTYVDDPPLWMPGRGRKQNTLLRM